MIRSPVKRFFRRLSRGLGVTRQCEICSKTFTVKPSHVVRGRGRFCSRLCAGVWKQTAYQGECNPKWRGGYRKRDCVECGVNFECSGGRALYCLKHRRAATSGERNSNWSGGKLPVTIVCCCCRKSFVVTASQARAGRKFCSHACSNIIKNKNNKKRNTALELAIQSSLEANRIPFQSQVPLHGIGLVDFLIGLPGTASTVLQCDGVYWHTLPGRAERDAKQDDALNALGYSVIRISDEELKKESVDVILKRKAWISTAHNQWRVSWR